MLKERLNLLLIFVLSIFSAGLAKAQIYGQRGSFGSFGGGSLGTVNIFGNYIDPAFIIWAFVFLILFALLNWLLGRTALKENKGSQVVIAFCVSALSVFGLMRIGPNFSAIFSSIGVSYSLIVTTILPIILGLMFLWVVWKKGKRWKRLGTSLFVLGLMLIIAGFTGLVYEQLIVSIVGGFLALLGLIILFKANSSDDGYGGGGLDWKTILALIGAGLLVLGYILGSFWLMLIGGIILGILLLIYIIKKFFGNGEYDGPGLKKFLLIAGLALMLIGLFLGSPLWIVLGAALVALAIIIHLIQNNQMPGGDFKTLLIVAGIILFILGVIFNSVWLGGLGLLLIILGVLMWLFEQRKPRPGPRPGPKPIRRHILKIGTKGKGSTSPSAGQYTYKDGRNVKITATPNSGAKFIKFVANGHEYTSNPLNLSMGQNYNVTAHFSGKGPGPIPYKNRYFLTVRKKGKGNTNPSPGTYTYKEGKKVSISANPSKNYRFSHFIVNGSKYTANPLNLSMGQNYDVTAHFKSSGGGKKKPRNAYLGVVIGRQKYSGSSSGDNATLDLSGGLKANKKKKSTTITVKNEGKGGDLGWNVRSQTKYIKASPKKGTLKAGETKKVTLTPNWKAIKSSKKNWVGISISGRGGGKTGKLPDRGRVGIWIKVR